MIASLLGWLLVASLAFSAQEGETRRVVETSPEGLTVEREVLVGAGGELTNHGDYRLLDADGREREQGSFDHGQRTGKWTLCHPNGEKAATGSYREDQRTGPWREYFADGEIRGKGRYKRGTKDGAWEFWTESGAADPIHSGEYATVAAAYGRGRPRYEGETVDGLKHGRWTYWWEHGTMQLAGSYERGRREGEWFFWHANGTPEEAFFSGTYSGGRRVAALVLGAATALPAAEPGELPGLASRDSTSRELSKLVDAAVGGSLTPNSAAELIAHGRRALPHVVQALLELDLTDGAELRTAAWLESQVLAPLCLGATYPISETQEPSVNELAAQRWATLWSLTHDDEAFWSIDMALAPGTPSLLKPIHREWLRGTSATVADVPLIYRERFSTGRDSARPERGPVRDSIDAGLAWLAAHQAEDGHWSSLDFAGRCDREPACAGPGVEGFDVGLTGLALLALLGDGNTPVAGPYRDTVARGLTWLRRTRDPKTDAFDQGHAPEWAYNHGIATLVLAEVLATCASPVLEVELARAIHVIERARNPFSAWRYESPPDGKSDTSVTGWMTAALYAADVVDVAVDPAAWVGARGWLEEATDLDTGRVGYVARGSASARTLANQKFPTEYGEAMTASALLSRILIAAGRGERLAQDGLAAKQAGLLRQRKPEWDGGFHVDLYYWFYGTHALYQLGGSHWKAWSLALEKAALQGQEEEGHEAGSWPPLGVWGYAGGRVYSTAMMLLCLEGSYRYARLTDM